jgi:hypothetical protein
MSGFEASGQGMSAAGQRFVQAAEALSSHPIHGLAVGDVGSAEVAGALRAFQSEWGAYLRARAKASTLAEATLTGAAQDVARADELMAQRAARLGRS